MPLSIVDYENVPPTIFSVLSLLASLENVISSEAMPVLPSTKTMISAIDEYRNSLALFIEEVGKRN